MRKWILCLLLFALLAPGILAEGDLWIDEAHLYDGMRRTYAQGYRPAITGNTAHIILPILPGAYTGDIQAELIPADPAATPVKLSNALTKTVQLKEYRFSGDMVAAYKVEFKLALHADRLNGEYPFSIVLRGRGADGEALTGRFDAALIVTDGQPNDAAPVLKIEDFDADGLIVGGEGAARMTIVNTSTSREAREITLRASDAKGDILPAKTNTLHLGALLPGEGIPVTLPLRALHSAAAEPHALELTLTYGYAENQSATVTERRTILIDQQVRLKHTEARLPTQVTQGENLQFHLTLYNMGRGDIRNALLTFDIPHLADGGSVLAGNLEPGESASATANLRVDGEFEGDTSGTLTLTWEDGYGKPFEKSLPLQTTVLKRAAAPLSAAAASGGVEPEPAGGFSHREIAAWSIAAAALALLALKTCTASRRIRRLEENKL